MSTWLHNYETVKLLVPHPEQVQLAIVALLGFIAAISLRKGGQTPLLDREQTDQLRGVAILFVVLGHLWVHVSASRPLVVLSGTGVTMFLLLSGFGLTLSCGQRCPEWKEFLKRRVTRVMIPYWITTVVFLILDGVILNRTCSARDLVLTFLGINASPQLGRIDYVRWFITFIMVWYLIFYLARLAAAKTGRHPLVFLFGGGLVLLVLDYYVWRTGWGNWFAFPIGCALANGKEWLRGLFERRGTAFVASGVAFLAGYVAYRVITHWPVLAGVPSVIQCELGEIVSLALTASLIVFLAVAGANELASRFLLLCGVVSYELFLLHGAILIKYDPVLELAPPVYLPLSFIALLGVFVLLALGLRRLLKAINV